MRRERIRLRWDRIGWLLAAIAVAVMVLGRAVTSGPTAVGAVTAGVTVEAAAAEPAATADMAGLALARTAGGCPATTSGIVDVAPGQGRTVALTFDDGPGEWTAATLDVLDRYGIDATFFVIGRSALAHPDLVARIIADGHQVGNHTWTHRPPPPAGTWPGSWLSEEYDTTQALLTRLTGTGACWFRPPEGVVGGSEQAAEEDGFSIAMWSVDSLDWKVQAGADADPDDAMRLAIGENAVAGLDQEHPVVLLHDGGGFRGATVAALPYIIERYDNLGYRFVRLDGR